MSGEESASEKTHEATPHRREQFRKQGRFARARDAGAIATIGATLGILAGGRFAVVRIAHELFRRCHGDLGALAEGRGAEALHLAGTTLVAMAAPCAVAAAIAGALAGVAQAGPHLYLELAQFKASRLDPFPRLAQLFQMKHGGAEALLSLLRIAVVGGVAYHAVRAELPRILSLGRASLDASAGDLTGAVTRVTMATLLALLGMAALDYFHSRISLEKEMRMSLKEILEETKQQEGDPKQKARLRTKSRQLAKKRSLANVKQATVVVTNPTHVAVALRYGDQDPAPVVVAKGHDDLALLIRAEARRHGVPILENRPLARALDAEVPLGHPVPAAHFVAVARVLAFVYRLRDRRGGTGRA
jgi:flagellar biosynthetic protein FlhB